MTGSACLRRKDREERFVGALLGTAYGDALGAGVEGMSRAEIRERFGEVPSATGRRALYRRHPDDPCPCPFLDPDGGCRRGEALVRTVGLGGDTDTIAAMTGSLVGALHGGDSFPRRWFAALENGLYGRVEIVRVGRRLAQLSEGVKIR